MHSLQLTVLPGVYAVCRLPPAAPVPVWTAPSTRFLSVTRTPDELSIVCEAALLPQDVQAERGWACLQVRGPLDFALVGVRAAIAEPLAKARVSVFAVSTYNTDYVLARAANLEQAFAALAAAGHDREHPATRAPGRRSPRRARRQATSGATIAK